MKPADLFKVIHVDEYSATPKYLQLSDSIISAIENGHLQKDDVLPSINELSYMLEISRDTAEKGYKYLKKLGVIVSVSGRGYYVDNADFKKKVKVFLLFNKLSAHKKIIYDSFVSSLGQEAAVDFYIYNNDFTIFKKLIQNRRTDYSHFIIIPHFMEGAEKVSEIINTIPKDKLILLDKKVTGVDGEFTAIYENFEKDIFGALSEVKEQLSKYHTLKLVFPKKSYFPQEIIQGFKRFCQQFAFNHKIVSDVRNEPILPGEVYVNLMEDDLVTLIERIISLHLEIGKDVGVISYNETPLKKLLLNGITTISTDFKLMGSLAADMINKQLHEHHEVPFYVTLRPSL
jgi:DNA-binding transcriptional regulator YhcF (GntR family)